MFWVGFIAWTWDAFDFFTVSLTVTEIAADFGEEPSAVTWVKVGCFTVTRKLANGSRVSLSRSCCVL